MTTAWGKRHISYALHVEPRRDLVITVHPDLTVHVRAPAACALEHVLRRVHARRAWIARQLVHFERLSQLPPPRFVSGETFLYLGREYRLRVEHTGRNVSLQAGRLIVCVPQMSGAKVVQAAVHDWYRGRARVVILDRFRKLQPDIPSLRHVHPHPRIRRMARRWGSCTSRGTITINPALMQAPRACLDYVLVHEMLHLIESSHSARFYRLLDQAMPDWRARRERLAHVPIRWV